MAKDRESRTLSKAAAKRAAADHLSAEERALWEHAARDLKPLKAKKSRVHGAHGGEAEAPARQRKEPERAVAQRTPSRPAPAPKPAAPPPLATLDRRKARKIGSGRIEVEARIDLHGMRQSEAYRALRRFLMEAHGTGRRWVLVITGKGGQRRAGSEAEAGDYGGQGEPGVLRRNVPRWLAEPELRAIVVGFTPAAIRHGGEGALYVQLRRRDRPEAR
jgi:DNA-nicking Smr family endonuclease